MQKRAAEYGSLPCGVPGYSCTVNEYRQIIQHALDAGQYGNALHYLQLARDANVLHRLSLATGAEGIRS